MKCILSIIIVLLINLSLFAQRGYDVVKATNNEKRLALVIGNAAYQHGGALKNPVNDANLMATTLKQLGFTVIKETDADLKTMQLATAEFTNKIKDYKATLFFYAGHGIQVDGINYLIPVDAKMDSRVMAKFEAFNISFINDAFMQNIDNINIMILDACRDNPFRSWSRGNERGFAKIENSARGTIIAFATQPGETASDGIGNNGLYTSKLVKEMKKNQDIEDVFKQTRIAVFDASNGKQVPQDWSSLMGDFHFVKKQGTKVIVSNNELNQFTDARDGKVYKTVKIGKQVWMAENLNYSNENSFCYDDKAENCEKYGRLYNWEAAKEVCPAGWHLPTKNDWIKLIKHLGTDKNKVYEQVVKVGGIGFDAEFGGWRMKHWYYEIDYNTDYWSSTPDGNTNVWCFSLSKVSKMAKMTGPKKDRWHSVRCIKN